MAHRYPFHRRQRLTKATGFTLVLLKGKRFFSRSFQVCSQRNSNSLGIPRLGLIISRKNLPFAVDRNTVKRMIRETFRQHPGVIKTFDYVVKLKTSPKEKRLGKHFLQSLREELHALFNQIKMSDSQDEKRGQRG